MTYNFDIDEWYDRELAFLQARHRRGELDDERLAEAIDILDRRREEMEARLDGTYRLPGEGT